MLVCYLNKELEISIVPVAINSAYNALPRGSWFPKPFTKIKDAFLNPVYPKDFTSESLKDMVKQQITRKLAS